MKRMIPFALLATVASASPQLSPEQQQWIQSEVNQKLYAGQATAQDLEIWEVMVAEGTYQVLSGQQHVVLPGPTYVGSNWSSEMCEWFKDQVVEQASDCRDKKDVRESCEDGATADGLDPDDECLIEQITEQECKDVKGEALDVWLDNC